MKPYRDENGKMLKGENCYHNQDGSCEGYKRRNCGTAIGVSPCENCIPADPKIWGDTKNMGLGHNALTSYTTHIGDGIPFHSDAVGYIAGSGRSHVKVYCQQCKYIRIVQKNTTFGRCPPCVCGHPDNLIESFEDKWYCRFSNTEHKRKPSEINKKNDCKWYDADPLEGYAVRERK